MKQCSSVDFFLLAIFLFWSLIFSHWLLFSYHQARFLNFILLQSIGASWNFYCMAPLSTNASPIYQSNISVSFGLWPFFAVRFLFTQLNLKIIHPCISLLHCGFPHHAMHQCFEGCHFLGVANLDLWRILRLDPPAYIIFFSIAEISASLTYWQDLIHLFLYILVYGLD